MVGTYYTTSQPPRTINLNWRRKWRTTIGFRKTRNIGLHIDIGTERNFDYFIPRSTTNFRKKRIHTPPSYLGNEEKEEYETTTIEGDMTPSYPDYEHKTTTERDKPPSYPVYEHETTTTEEDTPPSYEEEATTTTTTERTKFTIPPIIKDIIEEIIEMFHNKNPSDYN